MLEYMQTMSSAESEGGWRFEENGKTNNCNEEKRRSFPISKCMKGPPEL